MVEVSVTIPVYNVEKYLARCLDTILDQTFKLDYEIICVDDGSTDNSGNILEEYAKKYKQIKVIHQENAGLSEARNTALKYVTGKYTMFVDADDFIAKNTLDELYNFAEQKDADVVIFDFLSGAQGNKDLYRQNFPMITRKYKDNEFNIDSADPLVYRFVPVATWIKFYRTDLVKNIKFEKDLINQDVPHWAIVFSKAKKVYYLPVPYYFYVKEREQAITQIKNKKLFDVFKAFSLAKEALEDAGYFEKYKNIHYAHLASNLVGRLNKIEPVYRKNIVDEIKKYTFDMDFDNFYKDDFFPFEKNDMSIIRFVKDNKYEDVEKFLYKNNVWK